MILTKAAWLLCVIVGRRSAKKAKQDEEEWKWRWRIGGENWNMDDGGGGGGTSSGDD